MDFADIEQVGKDLLAAHPGLRHVAKAAYHRVSYLFLKEKIKCEGAVGRVSPDDGYEYFYGYYDKSPWSADERYMLCMRAECTNKSVAPVEPIDILILDTLNGYAPRKIGTSRSWSVQQGAMAQWLGPDFNSEVIYNDFRDGGYVSVVVNVESGVERVLPRPVYAVALDGTFALTLDFSRLHRLRPGYGYSNLPDATDGQLVPDGACIWKMDLTTGDVKGLFDYADFASFEPRPEMVGAEHKVNHLMINPSGTRFMVLHRWFQAGKKYTRLVTGDCDGGGLFNLSDDDFVSHCYWKNDDEIISFMRRTDRGNHYYLFKDGGHEYRLLWPSLKTDGHCSYSPDGSLVVTDTYPNRHRLACVYLCREDIAKPTKLATVFAPFSYDFDTRCDLHPRWDRKGEKVCFDSVHEGKRRLYVVNVADVGMTVHDINAQNGEQHHEAVDVESNLDRYKPGLFSVVMPVYNAVSTLNRSIESLLDQTIDNWELIAVDDGSSDDSFDLLSSYSARDARIRVILQENSGPGAARRRGICNACGEYVAFLDADDYWEPDFLEQVRNVIRADFCDVVFVEWIRERENGSVYGRTNVCTHAHEEKEQLIRQQMMGIIPWGQNKVIRHELIDRARSGFTDLDVGEEAVFGFEVLNGASSVGFVDKPIYHYVKTEGGQHEKGGLDPWLPVVHSVSEHLQKYGLLERYRSTVNGFALRSLCIAVYRCACLEPRELAIKSIKEKVEEYKNEFDFSDLNLRSIDRKTRLVYLLVRLKMYVPLRIVSKARKSVS